MATKRGNKILIQATIDPDQDAAIERLARTQRRSRASLLRTAIDVYLALNPAPRADADREEVAA